jgi:hypothetical protein
MTESGIIANIWKEKQNLKLALTRFGAKMSTDINQQVFDV